MSWEEFLIVKAYRAGLKPAPTDFFVKLLQDEQSLDLPVADLADQYSIEFKTCTGYRTAIFKAFGESESQKQNEKFKPLYKRLKKEFDRQSAQDGSRAEVPKSSAEQLHNLLRQFNYFAQERSVQDSLHPAAAFLVRIDDL
jgi:hypothetical protein